MNDPKQYRIEYKPQADDTWRPIAGLRSPLTWEVARAVADQVKDDAAAIRIVYLPNGDTVWFSQKDSPSELPQNPPLAQE